MPCQHDTAMFRETPYPGIANQYAPAGMVLRAAQAPDRAFRVSGLASVAAAGTGTAVTFTWQYPMHVIAMVGNSLADGSDAGLSSLGLQITCGDNNESIFSNGSAGDYVTLMCLHGRQFNPYNLDRWVHQSEIWTIQFKNYHGANAYTPELTFHARKLGGETGRNPNAAAAGIMR